MSYTSGTSGRPKGVRRPLPGGDPDDEAKRFNILNLFGIESGGEGVYLCGSPLYHASSWGFALAALHLGHRVTLMGKWTPNCALQLIEAKHVRYTHMVPTHSPDYLSSIWMHESDGTSHRYKWSPTLVPRVRSM